MNFVLQRGSRILSEAVKANAAPSAEKSLAGHAGEFQRDFQKAFSFYTPIALGVGVSILLLKHPHDHAHNPEYPFLHLRGKKYPWSNGDCNLFDLKCRKAAKEAKRGGAAPAPAKGHH